MISTKSSSYFSAAFISFALLVASSQLYGSLLISNKFSIATTTTSSSTLNNKSNDSFQNNYKMSPSALKTSSSSMDINDEKDPDGVNCKQLLEEFRNGKILEMERTAGYEKAFVTRTITSKPFYWSTHKPEIDSARASSYAKGLYYEKQLTARTQEIFDEKRTLGQTQRILLNVGGNICWFFFISSCTWRDKNLHI